MALENEPLNISAVVIEPDEMEEHKATEQPRLITMPADSEQDMASALLALKSTIVPGSPEGCKPLCHPQAFEIFSLTKSEKRGVSVDRNALALVDYDEVAAISEDEHEETDSIKRRVTSLKRTTKKRRIVEEIRPPVGIALVMPVLLASAGIPYSVPCGPSAQAEKTYAVSPMQTSKNCGTYCEAKSLAFIGKPLPPAPVLPRLLPGQPVALS